MSPTADLLPESVLSVPISNYGAGVYLLLSGNEIVYVGRAENLGARVHEHCETKEFDRAVCVSIPREVDRMWVEHWLVRALTPRLNKAIPDTSDYRPPHILADYGFGHLVERAAGSPTKLPNPKRGRRLTPAQIREREERRNFNKILMRFLRAGHESAPAYELAHQEFKQTYGWEATHA